MIKGKKQICVLLIFVLFFFFILLSFRVLGAGEYKYSSSICYWCFGSDEWICPSHPDWEVVEKIRLPYPSADDDYSCCCPTGLYDSYPGVVENCDSTTAFYCKYREKCNPITEICDNKDNDCDGAIDNGCDDDNDNYCDSAFSIVGIPSTCTAGGADCDDNNNSVHPGASEVCDLKDDDCDGIIDEGFDQDCDGFATCGGDCNDNNENVHLGAPEICNNIDDDCDGVTDENEMSSSLYFTWTVTGTGTESWGTYQYKYSSSICYWCFGSDNWICPSHSGWNIIETIRLPYPGADEDYSCCCPGGIYDSYPGVVENCDSTTAFYCKYKKELSSNSAQRTRRDSDSGYISLNDGIKDMGAFDAEPRAEMGGVISDVTYLITDNNVGVKTWINNNHVYACGDYNSDDICDTSTPEMWKCGTDTGECVSGVMICSSGKLICGGDYVGPSEEVCDNLDNDCDDLIDEDVKNACGKCGPVPEEVCDRIDNNCNGMIDDGLVNCDTDGDGIINRYDNCINAYNPDQLNSDEKFIDVGRLGDTANTTYVPGEILVKFREGGIKNISSLSTLGMINRKYSIKYQEKVTLGLNEHLGLKNIYKFKFSENANLTEIINEYLNNPSVEFAEPNYIYHTIENPNDAYFSRQWAHRNMESQKGWNIEKGDSAVLIAIIDTGVDYTHPDLAANIYSKGRDFYSGDYDAMDENGHGTHCAGIAAGVTNNHIGIAGTCWFCKILPVRFLGPSGSGTAEDAASAIIYAADSGVDVISNSWGGYGNSGIVHSAIKYAYNKGIVIVAAAGNDNTANPLFPGGYSEVIGVAATDSDDSKAAFSNYGSWVDVAAPGVGILSTFPDGYASLSGTSMATPHVAGLAGLILSANPLLSGNEVKQTILSSVDLVYSSLPIGTGRINLFKALYNVPSSPETFTWAVIGTGTEVWWDCPTEMTSTRTAVDSGSGSVSLLDRKKDMGTFDAEPLSQMGGLIFNVQYEISDNNEKVMTWIDGEHVYACLDLDSDNVCNYISILSVEKPRFDFRLEGGDLCDICPADVSDNCDVNYAGAHSINSSGGVVMNNKGTVKIQIPSGALQNETSMAITPKDVLTFKDVKRLNPIGFGYHLTPDEIKFNKSVTLSLFYREFNITNEDNLGILSFDGKNWVIQNSIIDKNNGTLTANITHFSTFVIANAIKGDVDFDCKVDIFDLAKVGLCYGQNAIGSCMNADLSGNGAIDIFDLATVGLNYGRSC